ncbi:hypothetical protein [Methylocaldum sp. 14B]|uniref:hypothetical protein n=1 Tax=Methylocaldum sp. 14B TaxID=1912213 RepID=UPI00098A07AB|nr:hypothetical protein [Methylocaldum sp. 14B]
MKDQTDKQPVKSAPLQRRRGRPSTGQAKTNAQRQAEWRAKRQAELQALRDEKGKGTGGHEVERMKAELESVQRELIQVQSELADVIKLLNDAGLEISNLKSNRYVTQN